MILLFQNIMVYVVFCEIMLYRTLKLAYSTLVHRIILKVSIRRCNVTLNFYMFYLFLPFMS